MHWPLSAAYWHAALWRWATPLAPLCVACSPSSDWSTFPVWSAGPACLPPSCSAPASAALSDNHRNTSRHLLWKPFIHHWVNWYTLRWLWVKVSKWRRKCFFRSSKHRGTHTNQACFLQMCCCVTILDLNKCCESTQSLNEVRDLNMLFNTEMGNMNNINHITKLKICHATKSNYIIKYPIKMFQQKLKKKSNSETHFIKCAICKNWPPVKS